MTNVILLPLFDVMKVPCMIKSRRRGWLWRVSQCCVIELSFVLVRRTSQSLNGLFIYVLFRLLLRNIFIWGTGPLVSLQLCL